MDIQDKFNDIQASGNAGLFITWKLANNILIISGSGEMPDYDYDYNIGAVSTPWDSYSNAITTIIIDSGVTNIEEWAFYGFNNLTSVSIPNSVTTIKNYAFAFCDSLTSVIIGNGVTYIGYDAFAGCIGLQHIYLQRKNHSQ